MDYSYYQRSFLHLGNVKGDTIFMDYTFHEGKISKRNFSKKILQALKVIEV
jgi:hypothetical protein